MAGSPAREESILNTVVRAMASRAPQPVQYPTYASRPHAQEEETTLFPLFIVSLIVHFIDLLTRLTMQSYPVFHFTAILMYLTLAIICSAMQLHIKNGGFLNNFKFFIALSALAYMIPFVNYLGAIANLTDLMFVGASIRTIVGFALLFAPIYPLYFMLVKTSKWTRNIGAVYMIFWVVILIMGMAPQFQTQGQIMGINVGEVYYKTFNFVVDGAVATWHKTVLLFIGAGQELQGQINIASGGNYGNVQQGSAGLTGIRISSIKPSQEQLFENEPISISALLESESVNEETEIILECSAKPTTGDTIMGITTPSTLTVQGKTSETVLCDFDKLDSNSYSIFFGAGFSSITRWSGKHYFMDASLKRYDESKNIDPLAGIDTSTEDGFSQGAINIGTSLQKLTGIESTQNEMTWSVSFSNRWPGIISSIDSAQFLVPKGFTIKTIDGYDAVEQKCSSLPAEEAPSCDDSITNVYSAPAELISKIKNVKSRKDFNIKLGVEPSQIIKGSVSTKTFAILASYNYKSSVDAYINVKKPL